MKRKRAVGVSWLSDRRRLSSGSGAGLALILLQALLVVLSGSFSSWLQPALGMVASLEHPESLTSTSFVVVGDAFSQFA